MGDVDEIIFVFRSADVDVIWPNVSTYFISKNKVFLLSKKTYKIDMYIVHTVSSVTGTITIGHSYKQP